MFIHTVGCIQYYKSSEIFLIHVFPLTLKKFVHCGYCEISAKRTGKNESLVEKRKNNGSSPAPRNIQSPRTGCSSNRDGKFA